MGRYRVTIQEAARRLGVKEAAVRKRIERGTLEKEKDADGRVYVYVEEPAVGAAWTSTAGEQRDGANDGANDGGNDAGRDGSYFASHPMGYDVLAESQREQIAFLREQLEAERRAHGEARRLLAAALERIPAIEAPQASPDERGSPETLEPEADGAEARSSTPAPQEGAQPRSWWREFFGFE